MTDPFVLLRLLATSPPRSRVRTDTPDTENYWGANDRFALLNHAAAEPYFARAALLPVHGGNNTESLLALALKRGRVAIRWVPTLGMLACCSSRRIRSEDCHTKVCVSLWLNASLAVPSAVSMSGRSSLGGDDSDGGRRAAATTAGGVVYRIKYIFEAQAAVQNAEVLRRHSSELVDCSVAACERPHDPQASPHHCVPKQALCLRPPPKIDWRALWHPWRDRSTSTSWRWADRPPWGWDPAMDRAVAR